MSVAFFRLAKLTFLRRQVGGRRFLTGGKLRSLKTAEETCIWHLVKHGFMCLLTGTIPLWETKATSVDSSVEQTVPTHFPLINPKSAEHILVMHEYCSIIKQIKSCFYEPSDRSCEDMFPPTFTFLLTTGSSFG